jgi:pimeloyl-ACP methyl ester carboxylesterase
MMEGVGRGLWEKLAPERLAILEANVPTMPLLLKQTPPPVITAADLARLDLPVLVAWGAASRAAFTVPSRAAAAALRHGVAREIAGADHMWPETDPDGFAALVRDFVSAAPSRRS